MNKEQQELLDEAYQKYCKIANSVEEPDYEIHVDDPHQNCTRLMTTDEFINKCKTNTEFSQRWGLKIEERRLSEKERIILAGFDYENRGGIGWNMLKESVDADNSIPRKLITITHNDIKIESYEQIR